MDANSNFESVYAELAVVRLRHAVHTELGTLPADTPGTIVHVYNGHAAYEVEFAAPFHLVTLTDDDLTG